MGGSMHVHAHTRGRDHKPLHARAVRTWASVQTCLCCVQSTCAILTVGLSLTSSPSSAHVGARVLQCPAHGTITFRSCVHQMFTCVCEQRSSSAAGTCTRAPQVVQANQHGMHPRDDKKHSPHQGAKNCTKGKGGSHDSKSVDVPTTLQLRLQQQPACTRTLTNQTLPSFTVSSKSSTPRDTTCSAFSSLAAALGKAQAASSSMHARTLMRAAIL